MMAEFCPLCLSKGRKVPLKFFQMNLSEATKMCTDTQCIYPLTLNLTDTFIQRDFKELAKLDDENTCPDIISGAAERPSDSSDASLMSSIGILSDLVNTDVPGSCNHNANDNLFCLSESMSTGEALMDLLNFDDMSVQGNLDLDPDFDKILDDRFRELSTPNNSDSMLLDSKLGNLNLDTSADCSATNSCDSFNNDNGVVSASKECAKDETCVGTQPELVGNKENCQNLVNCVQTSPPDVSGRTDSIKLSNNTVTQQDNKCDLETHDKSTKGSSICDLIKDKDNINSERLFSIFDPEFNPAPEILDENVLTLQVNATDSILKDKIPMDPQINSLESLERGKPCTEVQKKAEKLISSGEDLVPDVPKEMNNVVEDKGNISILKATDKQTEYMSSINQTLDKSFTEVSSDVPITPSEGNINSNEDKNNGKIIHFAEPEDSVNKGVNPLSPSNDNILCGSSCEVYSDNSFSSSLNLRNVEYNTSRKPSVFHNTERMNSINDINSEKINKSENKVELLRDSNTLHMKGGTGVYIEEHNVRSNIPNMTSYIKNEDCVVTTFHDEYCNSLKSISEPVERKFSVTNSFQLLSDNLKPVNCNSDVALNATVESTGTERKTELPLAACEDAKIIKRLSVVDSVMRDHMYAAAEVRNGHNVPVKEVRKNLKFKSYSYEEGKNASENLSSKHYSGIPPNDCDASSFHSVDIFSPECKQDKKTTLKTFNISNDELTLSMINMAKPPPSIYQEYMAKELHDSIPFKTHLANSKSVEDHKLNVSNSAGSKKNMIIVKCSKNVNLPDINNMSENVVSVTYIDPKSVTKTVCKNSSQNVTFPHASPSLKQNIIPSFSSGVLSQNSLNGISSVNINQVPKAPSECTASSSQIVPKFSETSVEQFVQSELQMIKTVPKKKTKQNAVPLKIASTYLLESSRNKLLVGKSKSSRSIIQNSLEGRHPYHGVKKVKTQKIAKLAANTNHKSVTNYSGEKLKMVSLEERAIHKSDEKTIIDHNSKGRKGICKGNDKFEGFTFDISSEEKSCKRRLKSSAKLMEDVLTTQNKASRKQKCKSSDKIESDSVSVCDSEISLQNSDNSLPSSKKHIDDLSWLDDLLMSN